MTVGWIVNDFCGAVSLPPLPPHINTHKTTMLAPGFNRLRPHTAFHRKGKRELLSPDPRTGDVLLLGLHEFLHPLFLSLFVCAASLHSSLSPHNNGVAVRGRHLFPYKKYSPERTHKRYLQRCLARLVVLWCLSSVVAAASSSSNSCKSCN